MAKPANNAKETVSINFDIPVLRYLERYCFKRDLGKSQVVNRAVKRYLACKMSDDPAFWDEIYDKLEENGKT